MPGKFITILMTAPSEKEARRIISALITKRLVACANLLNGVDSTFIWKGKIDKAKEFLVIFKTRRNLFKRVEAQIRRLHSYEVPEIIAVPIVAGNKEYLKWIDEVVGENRPSFHIKKN